MVGIPQTEVEYAAGQAEYGTRGAHAEHQGIGHVGAGQRSPYSGGKVDHCESGCAEKTFNYVPEIVQGVGIHG